LDRPCRTLPHDIRASAPMTVSGDESTRAHKVAAAGLPAEEEAEKHRKYMSKTLLDKQMHKTRLCHFHKSGGCKYGSKCTFAHQRDELQEAPNLRKTRLCMAFANGECKDQSCKFAHGQDELRSTDFCFKTTLCVWHAQGKCTNGSRCRFAHGTYELRKASNQLVHSSYEEGTEEVGGQQQGYHDPMKVQPAPFMPTSTYPDTGNAASLHDDPQLSALYNMAYLSAVDHLVSDAGQQRHGGSSTTNLWSSPCASPVGTLFNPNVGPPSEQLYGQFCDPAPNHVANQVASQVAHQQFMKGISMLGQHAQSQMHLDQLAKWLGAAAPSPSMPTQATSSAMLTASLAAATRSEMATLSENLGCGFAGAPHLFATSKGHVSPTKATAEDYSNIAGRLSNLSEQMQALESRMECIYKAKLMSSEASGTNVHGFGIAL